MSKKVINYAINIMSSKGTKKAMEDLNSIIEMLIATNDPMFMEEILFVKDAMDYITTRNYIVSPNGDVTRK